MQEAIQALGSDDEDERDGAIEALVGMGSKAVPALARALEDANTEVRWAAATALGEIGPEAIEAIFALIHALEDDGPMGTPGRSRGAGGDGAGSGRSCPRSHPGPGRRERTSARIRRPGAGINRPRGKRCRSPLIQALGDESAEVRGYAAMALGSIGPEAAEAVSALIQALGDEYPSVRSGAAGALGAIGPEAAEAIPALAQALEDKDEFVRRAAATALGFIGPESVAAIPALVQALEDENWEVREAATLALNMIGPDAIEAVPALIQALGDESDNVRASAAWALVAITGQDFGQDGAAWQQWWDGQ